MTAEIAVINKSAVALAADSAVTITNPNGKTKIYNGAEKLFALTKYHPVGIMVFGSGTLCRVPWEVVIKEYRKTLGERCFATLDEYTEDFFQFLEQADKLIPYDLRDLFLENHWLGIYLDIWEQVSQKVEELVKEEGAEDLEEKTMQILSELCTEFSDILDRQHFLTDFSQDDVEALSKESVKFVEGKLAEASFELTEPLKANLATVLALATAKENPLGANSGVVFAGYGDQEYFPSILTFDLKGFWGKKLRRVPDLDKSCGGGSSGIEAYAQDEEALTFMRGVSPEIERCYSQAFFDSFDSVLRKAMELIEQNTDKDCVDVKKALEEHALERWQAAQRAMSGVIQKDYVDRVVNMVEFLPKDELAYMAESLVNMTAFKRKVTNDSETVGGPIDVAVISKGDGFVWIKRKHYFDGGLNNHYFEKFSKGS
ncbi:conserved hypothetical protein [Alteromonas macleodii]|jgi:hypothetical protein|uniref:hypothetical protein n=1 Tax=Alteromonas sp. BZK5 TaxID=1904459 RepID=UPI001653D365|nr:hypothetical protein [Alteromonas sp. BZK5]MBC6984442.1 hypothetical protein [Alteromonas sp. BZK5]